MTLARPGITPPWVKLARRQLGSMSQQLRVPVGLLDDLNVDDQIL